MHLYMTVLEMYITQPSLVAPSASNQVTHLSWPPLRLKSVDTDAELPTVVCPLILAFGDIWCQFVSFGPAPHMYQRGERVGGPVCTIHGH